MPDSPTPRIDGEALAQLVASVWTNLPHGRDEAVEQIRALTAERDDAQRALLTRGETPTARAIRESTERERIAHLDRVVAERDAAERRAEEAEGLLRDAPLEPREWRGWIRRRTALLAKLDQEREGVR